jgi:predicted glycoside hydrolase/deacetylase ChbG (UPF0249 family)/2-polyprenyl-3-methyl-5-hydroxy-6-metoxy-1,4-benzoquinol methylase
VKTAVNPERLLVVNADDYALTEGVCRGVLEAHRRGIVTSTSVLAVGRAFARCGPWLRDAPGLGVGVHLAAVGEDAPVLEARQIPSLVDDRGRLPRTWRDFTARWLARRIDPADLAREFEAQVATVAELGVPLTHLDTHQHLHLLPDVAEIVLGLARRARIEAVRVPRSRGLRRGGLAVTCLAEALARRAAQLGIRFTEDAAGFDEAGALDAEGLSRALDTLAAGGGRTLDLATHPGTEADDERARFRWAFRWPQELAALTHEGLPETIARRGLKLVSYAALSGPGRGEPPDLASLIGGLYGGAPLGARVHAELRWRTCPMRRIAALVPRRGRVLEIGCGHALLSAFLAIESRERAVTGIDVDERKVAVARLAARRARSCGARLEILQTADGHIPEGPWHAVVIADVLYLLSPAAQRALLDEAVSRLEPRGVLVVKEVAREPAWKFRWSRLQETVAVRLLGLTRGGAGLFFTPPGTLRSWLEEAGLSVEEHALHEGYPHPHHVLVGRRADRGPAEPS